MSIINKLATAHQNGLLNDEYWQKRLEKIIAIQTSEMVFQNLGVEKDIPMKQGTKTFTARRYNRLPVDLEKMLLQEGVAPDSMKIEGQKVSGTVHQYGALIKITDVMEDIHFDNIREVYQPELARHATEARERIVLASFSEASEYFVGNALAKDGLTNLDVLNFKDLRRIGLILKVNVRRGHPKAGGRPLVVVTPQVMQDLLDDDDLTKKMLATGMENSPIKNGSLKSYQVYDMFVQETLMAEKEVVTPAVGDPFTVYTSYVLGENAYWVLKLGNLKWYNVPFTATIGNELGQIASVGYKMWSGAKVVDPLAIFKVYSRSNYDVADEFDAYDTNTWSRPADQTEPITP